MIGKYITIGGKEYLLKITINSMVEMINKNPNLMDSFQDGTMDIGILRTLFYYQLKNKENDLKKFKLEDAGDLMTAYFEEGGGFIELVTLISEVQQACMGISNKELENLEDKGE